MESMGYLWFSYAVAQHTFLYFTRYLLKIDNLLHDYPPVILFLKLFSLADKIIQSNVSFLSKLLSGEIDFPNLFNCINLK